MISTFEEWAPRRRLRLPFCQQATSECRRESLPGADCDVICDRREDAMLRKPSCLLALVVLLCAIAQARVSVADGPPFIGHLRQGTVELIGITYYRPTSQARWWNRARWWRADGSAAQIGPFRPQGTHVLQMFADMKTLTFLVRVTLPPDRSRADQYVPSLARSSDPYAPSDPSPSDRYVLPEQPSKAQVGYGESTADASWPAWEFSDPATLAESDAQAVAGL